MNKPGLFIINFCLGEHKVLSPHWEVSINEKINGKGVLKSSKARQMSAIIKIKNAPILAYHIRIEFRFNFCNEDVPPEIEILNWLWRDLIARRYAAWVGVNLLMPGFSCTNEVNNTNKMSEAFHRRRVGVECLSNTIIRERQMTTNISRRPVGEESIKETLERRNMNL